MSQNSPGFSHLQKLAALHGKLALAGLVVLLALCVSSTVFAGYPVTVVNNCSKTIHIRAGGNGAGAFHELDKVALDPKKTHVYTVDAPYNNARVYGCWDTVAMDWDFYYDVNVQKHCALTEFTLSNVDGRIFTDVSFVDFISLPSRMELLGCKAGNPVSYCDSKDPTQPTKCRVTAQHTVDELKTCPTTLYTGMACESSYQFCKHSPGNPKCKKFDDNIRKCANNPKTYPGCDAAVHATTKNVYGCEDFFASATGKKYCAQMNRGTFGKSGVGIYTAEPYNDYAKWTHHIAGDIYAFPYDDVGDRSGTIGCTASTGLVITFCPLTKKTMKSTLGDGVGGFLGLDMDVYRFQGKAGEEVVITLEKTGRGSGGAFVTMKGPGLMKTTHGKLPRKIQTKLLRSGTYTVYVSNLSDEGRYSGPYNISIKSSKKAWTTFSAASSVESEQDALFAQDALFVEK